MNQILSVDNSPKEQFKKEKVKKQKMRNSGPIGIDSILKFFSIAILIFGIFMIGSGSYSMYKEMSSEETDKKPVLSLEQKSEDEITLKVTHDKPLAEVKYTWNSEESVDVPCNGNKEVETTIEVPTGVNSLTIIAKDINGKETQHNEVYNIEKDININVEAEGKNLKVTVNGKNTLSYMTYRWDEDEETKLDINSNEFEQTIEIPMGLHVLTVIAVDENNETETFEQEVNGVTKPELQVTTDGSSNFIIKASDEQGIKKVEFAINGKTYKLDLEKVLPLEERKEFEYSYPLTEGENRLDVTVYNEDDVSETFSAFVNM